MIGPKQFVFLDMATRARKSYTTSIFAAYASNWSRKNLFAVVYNNLQNLYKQIDKLGQNLAQKSDLWELNSEENLGKF